MVIEYFSQQAAQELPVTDLDWSNWDKHMWLTCYDVSLKLERIVNPSDWAALLNAQLDWQTFDRNPDGYLHERGYDANDAQKHYMTGVLEDVLSMQIDMTYNTSKAA